MKKKILFIILSTLSAAFPTMASDEQYYYQWSYGGTDQWEYMIDSKDNCFKYSSDTNGAEYRKKPIDRKFCAPLLVAKAEFAKGACLAKEELLESEFFGGEISSTSRKLSKECLCYIEKSEFLGATTVERFYEPRANCDFTLEK